MDEKPLQTPVQEFQVTPPSFQKKPSFLSKLLIGSAVIIAAFFLFFIGAFISLRSSPPATPSLPIEQNLSPTPFITPVEQATESSQNIPPITESELSQGWYRSTIDQKKPGTPDDWTFAGAGNDNGMWYKPGTSIQTSLENTKVVGIQTTGCCSCPQLIDASLVGKEGWEYYEKGKDYTSPSCGQVSCEPCEPIEGFD